MLTIVTQALTDIVAGGPSDIGNCYLWTLNNPPYNSAGANSLPISFGSDTSGSSLYITGGILVDYWSSKDQVRDPSTCLCITTTDVVRSP